MRLDTSRKCPSHDPDHPVVRCDGARGHKPSDVHWAELGGRQYRWGAALQEARPTKPPTGDFTPSEHYLASEIFTDGIKATFISMQLLDRAEARCVLCNQVIVTMDLDASIDLGSPEYEEAFDKALATAMSLSDKHHSDRRRGHGYRPKKYGNDFGHDSPLLIEAPICKQCHTGRDSEIHPGPLFARPTP